MLCCVGLIGGSVVGQALGGPWTFIGPAAGFGIGLVGDMKMMKRFHRKAGPQQSETELRAKADADPEAPNQGAASAPAAQSGSGCGIASGLMRGFGMKESKGEMTLAEIRKTYETDSSAQPSVTATMANAQPAAAEKTKSA